MTVLQMWLFGDFGYDELIAEYEQANPDVSVVVTKHGEDPESYGSYHETLARLAGQEGAPDVAAVATEFLARYRAHPRSFHNLFELGGAELQERYLGWKWRQGLTPDGSALTGLGTDIGPMTMCYRRDLLETAGLPADRDDLSGIWSTWDSFIDFGQRYTAATGRAFITSGGVIFEAMVNQTLKRHYETDGAPIYDSNRRLKHAWDVATSAITSGITANVMRLTEGWSTALRTGGCAALPCPAWMRPFVERAAADAGGAWDMTLMPEGGGNWGGSFLVLPAGGGQRQEAFRFVRWLLAPPQQLSVFTRTGNFPSTPELYSRPEIEGFTSDFFGNAPLGQLYAASALRNIEPLEGPADGMISDQFQRALQRVEQRELSPEQAWDAAVGVIRRVLSE